MTEGNARQGPAADALASLSQLVTAAAAAAAAVAAATAAPAATAAAAATAAWPRKETPHQPPPTLLLQLQHMKQGLINELLTDQTIKCRIIDGLIE